MNECIWLVVSRLIKGSPSFGSEACSELCFYIDAKFVNLDKFAVGVCTSISRILKVDDHTYFKVDKHCHSQWMTQTWLLCIHGHLAVPSIVKTHMVSSHRKDHYI